MSEGPMYTAHHPRWLRSRMSTYWWLGRWPYFTFILREVSSIFVAWFVVFLLMLIRAVSQGEGNYRQFLDWSGNQSVVVLNLISLFFVVFHAITWFNLAPQVIVVRVAGRRVPGLLIAASNYAAWLLSSAIEFWFLLRD